MVHANFFTKTSFEKADLLSSNYFKPAAMFYVISISVSQANDFLAGLITFREIFEGSTDFKHQNPVKVAHEKIKSKCSIFSSLF